MRKVLQDDMRVEALAWPNNRKYAKAFPDVVRSSFDSAAEADGIRVRYYRIANHLVQLRLAGDILPSLLTPAIRHLAISAGCHPDLTICLWESASTGVPLHGAPWDWNNFDARGASGRQSRETIRVSLDVNSGMLYMYDSESRTAYCWIRDAQQLPVWEIAAPLRLLLGWWATDIGGQLIHGAAVGCDGDGALVTARGGSGKSTTALACLEQGMQYAGDDYVLVIEGQPPSVFSLYNTAKVDRRQLSKMLPSLLPYAPLADQRANEKSTLFLCNSHQDQLVDHLRLRAILVPKIMTNETSTLRHASPIEALKAMAPSTLFQLPGSGRDEFQYLGRLVRNVRTHVLELGRDLPQVAGVIRDLVRSPCCRSN